MSIGFNTNSEFQRVQIIETAAFGKTLVLDGKTQSAQVSHGAGLTRCAVNSNPLGAHLCSALPALLSNHAPNHVLSTALSLPTTLSLEWPRGPLRLDPRAQR